MDLKKPLQRPVETGVKVVGWSIGLVRGTAVAAAEAVMGHKNGDPARDFAESTVARPTAEPRTQVPQDLPTPADLAEQVAPSEDVTTPVGTTGAGPAYNPDTTESDLQQPGTEPLMDPATTKAVASESEML